MVSYLLFLLVVRFARVFCAERWRHATSKHRVSRNRRCFACPSMTCRPRWWWTISSSFFSFLFLSNNFESEKIGRRIHHPQFGASFHWPAIVAGHSGMGTVNSLLTMTCFLLAFQRRQLVHRFESNILLPLLLLGQFFGSSPKRDGSTYKTRSVYIGSCYSSVFVYRPVWISFLFHFFNLFISFFFFHFFGRIFPSIEHGRIQKEWIIRRCVTFLLTNNSRNSRKKEKKKEMLIQGTVSVSIHRVASLSRRGAKQEKKKTKQKEMERKRHLVRL